MLVVVRKIKGMPNGNSVLYLNKHAKMVFFSAPCRLGHPLFETRVPSNSSMPTGVVRSKFGVEGIFTFVRQSQVADAVVQAVLVYVVYKTFRPRSKIQGPDYCMCSNLDVEQRADPVSATVNSREGFFVGVPSIPDCATVFRCLLSAFKQLRLSWKPRETPRRKVRRDKFADYVNFGKLFFHVTLFLISFIVVHEQRRRQALCAN